jgi:hypothetical protein
MLWLKISLNNPLRSSIIRSVENNKINYQQNSFLNTHNTHVASN